MPDEAKPKKAEPKKEGKPAAAAGAPEKAPAKPGPEAPPVAPAESAAEAAKTAGAPIAAAAPTAAELLGEDPNAKKIIKAKGSKNIASGIANILATFNNTQVSITDMHGNLIGW